MHTLVSSRVRPVHVAPARYFPAGQEVLHGLHTLSDEAVACVDMYVFAEQFFQGMHADSEVAFVTFMKPDVHCDGVYRVQ